MSAVDVLAVMDEAALSQPISTDRSDMREARDAVAELIEQNRVMRAALTKLAQAPGCGCGFPCRCNGDEWTRAELEGRMDFAYAALARVKGEAA